MYTNTSSKLGEVFFYVKKDYYTFETETNSIFVLFLWKYVTFIKKVPSTLIVKTDTANNIAADQPPIYC
ncbi:hypothetical protein [Robertmurraya sp. FSL R5-0851]|uniref:hypothetical protein n=1 Tax=Robertmurraya sp. FSL R5-0851 TaxID=2921584 RepID=UPI0030FD1988